MSAFLRKDLDDDFFSAAEPSDLEPAAMSTAMSTAMSMDSETAIAAEPGTSLDAQLEEGVGVPVSSHRLTLSLDLGGDMILFDDETNRLYTEGSGAVLDISVGDHGLHIGARGLAIEHELGRFVPNAHIDLNSIHWPFGGAVSVDSSANLLVETFANPNQAIASALTATLTDALPARMHDEDYNPFLDDQLLPALEGAFLGAARGPRPQDSSPEHEASETSEISTSHARLSFGFTLDEELERRSDEDTAIAFPAGSQITVRATSAQGVPSELGELRLDKLELACHGDVMVSFLGGEVSPITIEKIVIMPGGAVEFAYELVTETAANLLMVLAGLATKDVRILQNARPSRHERLREKIDAMLATDGAPMVRDMLAAHADAIPGVDLLAALCIDQ